MANTSTKVGFDVQISDTFGYVHNLDDATTLIRNWEIMTTSSFTTWKVKKEFGNTDPLAEQHSVKWSDKSIDYDGIPYIFLGIKVLDCTHGKDRKETFKEHKKSANQNREHGYAFKRRNLLQNTKKLGCAAQVTIREIMKFPQHKISSDTPRKRRTASEKIKRYLQEGKADGERRFYIHLPTKHDNHFIGEASGIQQQVDPQIIAKIHQLVGIGVTTVNEMRRHLKEYVRREMFAGKEVPPSTSRRFHPTKKDIMNHIYCAIVKRRFSSCDQVNVAKMVRKWVHEYPNDKFYFRPYADAVQQDSTSDLDTEDGVCDSDEDVDVKVTKPLSRQRMIFVHQTQWQSRLLTKYGNDICLLDATYKTTRYALPLFFIAVRTNVDYQIVGSFVIQDECTDTIKEALGIFKKWNKIWTPRFFMTDCCDEEINAIEETFDGCLVYICDFHREQAWERWVSKKDNGVWMEKETVLAHLRRVARATSAEKYNTAVTSLKALSIWQENSKLRNWLNNTWIKISKRWAWAFRHEGFNVRINTNNGLERQNQVFKYTYLQRHKNNSLSGMVTVLVEEYLPDNYSRYVEKNVRFSSSYRAYSKDVPEFLVDRPRDVVTHCMERLDLARDISSNDILITDHTNGHFQVQSQSGSQVYNLHFGNPAEMPHCDCLDWTRTYLPCKHFLAVFLHYPDWQWKKLPHQYRESPILSLDSHILQQFVRPESKQVPKVPHVHNEENQDVDDGSTFCPDENMTLPLPRKKHNSRSEAAKVREILSQIRSLTFLVQDYQALSDLHSSLFSAMEEFTKYTNTEGGIDLEEPKQSIGCKRSASSEMNEHTLPLPSRTKKHKYTGRVGEVAQVMKSMYKVSKGVHDLITAKTDNVNGPIPYMDTGCESYESYGATTEHMDDQDKLELDVGATDGEIIKDESSDVLSCDKTGKSGAVVIDDDDDDDEDDIQIIGEGKTSPVPKRKLRKLHKDDIRIIKTGRMLTDNSINIAQNILHDQYPLVDGLEDTVLGPLYSFSISRGQFVQILHDGALHWLCVSNIDCLEPGIVNIYDSLNQGGYITAHVKKQIANILHQDSSQIAMHIKEVQQQDNGTDCGIYAIAYATSILHGQNPEEVVYDTSKLREHLLACVTKGVMTPFPQSKQYAQRSRKKNVMVQLFCSCRMPWDASDRMMPAKQMAQCDACHNWYHRSCENIPQQIFNTHSYWQCSRCCEES